jgi:hypothetical protein
MINTLYISTVDYKWTKTDSQLLNDHNLKKIIDASHMVDVHTSVEDLFCENINVACNHACRIVLVNIDENTQFTNNNCFSYGQLFRSLIQNSSKIDNFDLSSFKWQKDLNYLYSSRTTDTPVLWTAGCSVTNGVGVDHDQRWGTLLSGSLNLPEVSLSLGGSSIFWSADQLLRSDIRSGDTVVWGLTALSRTEVSEDWNFSPANIDTYYKLAKEKQYWTLDYFASETEVLTAARNILQVINFCQKIQARLYLANLLDKDWIGVLFKDFENFIDLTMDLPLVGSHIQFIDLGTDGKHPGPRQHQHYSTQLHNFIKESKHGKTI